ncbi:hypothetical protein MKZ38_002160 [Zalerion maritima]|uniref:Uncharacterized protein n=1 Tax=Zalerion maritima TaxID=339359 RepID=A0AAD5RFI0_9PEZI|nr:hypothetical protein MKZ38_002160 [Zalerion maritima]
MYVGQRERDFIAKIFGETRTTESADDATPSSSSEQSLTSPSANDATTGPSNNSTPVGGGVIGSLTILFIAVLAMHFFVHTLQTNGGGRGGGVVVVQIVRESPASP